MKLSYFHQHIIPSCTYYYIVLSDLYLGFPIAKYTLEIKDGAAYPQLVQYREHAKYAL
jgi:hypothetical protein